MKAKEVRWVVDPETGCWEWQLFRAPEGYGRVTVGRARGVLAHRWAYEAFVGPIPSGAELDHLCRNRGCVNPEHLEPVTRAEHAQRSLRARKTHCDHAHEFTPENTYSRPDGKGKRACRACNRAAVARYKSRRAS